MTVNTRQAPAGTDVEPAFPGFEPLDSNYIYCPNQFFEVCLRHHSRSCVRLVAYMLRQTLGFLDHEGRPTKQDIRIPYTDLATKAGISTRSIPAAIKEAESAGFIECVKRGKAHTAGATGQPSSHRLRWSAAHAYTVDVKEFDGFFSGEGHRTPIPQSYFDLVVPTETLSLSKVVGTVLRHTVGYQNQFGGRRSDAPLSFSYIQKFAEMGDRTSLAVALKTAIEHGYLRCTRPGRFDPSGGNGSQAARYAIQWLCEATSQDSTAKTRPADANEEHGKNQTGRTRQKPDREDGRIPTGNTAKNRLSKHGKNPTQEKTRTKDIYKQQHPAVASEMQRAIECLREAGFDEDTASELAQERGLAEIQNQIAWIDERNPRDNKLGMLRKAIEQGWEKPISVAAAEKRIQLGAEARKQLQREEAEDQEAAKRKQKRLAAREQAEKILTAMSDQEKMEIEESAFTRLTSDFYRKRFQTHADFRRKLCLDAMCQNQGTTQHISPKTL